MKKQRLYYFDNFRAIAILMIIFGHCYNLWKPDLFAEKFVVSTITGGSGLFVFISGFFFHHHYFQDFDFKLFLLKKIKYVALPYLFLSIGFMALFVFFGKSHYIYFPVSLAEDPLLSSVYAFIANLLTGHTLSAYWYVPFAMLLFAASPFVVAFIGAPLKVKIFLVSFLFVFSMYVHRPWENINTFHSFVYFLPFYLFGVMYSEWLDVWDSWLRKYFYSIFSVWVFSVVLMVFFGQSANLHKMYMMEYSGVDLMVIQKVLLICVLIAGLKKFEYSNELLRFIADSSFALYFIHPIVLFFLGFVGVSQMLHGFLGFLLLAMLVIFISIVVSVLTKKILGDNSRMLIGY